MKDKMKVLFITPAEVLCDSILKIAENYPRIETTVLTGNEHIGRKLAMDSFSENYDCIISRGNTANLIRQAVSIPVVEVQVTLKDVLGSFADAKKIPSLVAAVGYNNVVSSLHFLNRFLPFEVEPFGFDSTEELPQIFRTLRARNIHTIVCDAIAYQMATPLGFDAHLLLSCDDSIRYAFAQVMLLYQSSGSMLEENQLLRRLTSVNSECETVVFSQDFRLYYSSLGEQSEFPMEFLTERLKDFETHASFKIIKHLSGWQYRISAKKLSIANTTYFVFFISHKIPDLEGTRKGIRSVTESEIRREMEGSVFQIANLEKYYSSELNRALVRKNPVLIFGEVGVGKNHLAEMIYLNSRFTKSPFIFVDFPLMSKQTWDYFIEKKESPLCDNGNTLFLKNIDALNSQQLSQLLTVLEESGAAKRNRILISCSARPQEQTAIHLQKTMCNLSCLAIHMLSLQGQYGTIENSIKLLLNYFRTNEELPVWGIAPDAMSLLLHYPWPHNYLQLIRVIHKVSMLARNGTITKAMVSEALTTEMYMVQAESNKTMNNTLDLTKTLAEINGDIVRILLETKGGNQTLAAKSLGISRTTMWRMLKSSQPMDGNS